MKSRKILKLFFDTVKAEKKFECSLILLKTDKQIKTNNKNQYTSIEQSPKRIEQLFYELL